MVAKKTVVRKKSVARKKAGVKKRTVAKKSAAKKITAKKKAAPKRSTVAKKKASVKRKPAAKRKSVTTKPSLAKSKADNKLLAKEEKKKKRVELLKRRSSVAMPVEGVAAYTTHRGESYMSPKQLKHFRKILLQWKQELLDEVNRTVDHMKKDASQFADPADRATQEEEFSLELRTRDREGKLVRKINQTLAAIDADEYGYCESCGVEIGIKRLEARPTATLCIDCKTLQEIKEKQNFT